MEEEDHYFQETGVHIAFPISLEAIPNLYHCQSTKSTSALMVAAMILPSLIPIFQFNCMVDMLLVLKLHSVWGHSATWEEEVVLQKLVPTACNLWGICSHLL